MRVYDCKMLQGEMQDLEKLPDNLRECQIEEKNPTSVVMNETWDLSILKKFPKQNRNIPPVFLHKPVKFTPLMRKVLNLGISFYRPFVGHHYTKICCETLDDHKALTEYFKNKLIPFHTYGYPDQKKMKVVFKGLPKDVDLDHFKNTLELASIPVVRVHKMHNKERAKDRPLLVLIIVPNNDKGRKILQVQKFFEHNIEVEPLNPRIMQCYRCQKWGHAQRYCYGHVKCVKCAGDHNYKECNPDPTKRLIRCANCGCDHTSNYKECPFSPYSKEYVKKMSESAVTKRMFPDICDVPKKLVTLENYHLFLRGRI